MNDTNRVLKNTLALYVRMIFLTLISLFTYRVVLQVLGASDYGTYNVVGGVITMFAFLSGTMTLCSQRYFAIALVDDDWNELSRLFSINTVIYIVLALVILFFAETIGLWFVLNKLNLDYSRMTTIVVVYEVSIVVFLISLLISPFLALLVADENLTMYSWVSILEGILKIVVTYLLYTINGDKLAIYAILQLMVSLVTNGFYVIYCFTKYKQLSFCFCKEIGEYKAIFSFLNWNLIGAVAAVGKNQGINIIINIFFGTVVNAARGIAFQLHSVISSFAQNFMKAIDPRITKAFAADNKDSFISVIYVASKLSYYLLLMVALPFMANINYVLTLWLVEVPEYTAIFTILALIDALILTITDSILTAVQATGKIKTYQITVGTLALLNLPLSYILLRITSNPIVPFAVAILIDLLMTFARLLNFKQIYTFSVLQYCKQILLPLFVVTALSVLVDFMFLGNAESFLHLIRNVIGSVVVMCCLIYCIGLNGNERQFVKGMIPFRKKR